MNKFYMRADLAAEGLVIPAFDDVDDKADYHGLQAITAAEIAGAIPEGDCDDETHPRSVYRRLRLKDGRLLYFVNADIQSEGDV